MPASRRSGAAVAVGVVALPVLTVVMICSHEIGHTVMAWLLGDRSARFVLIGSVRGSTCLGCNQWNSAALSSGANALVTLGGVLATALLTWVALWLLARRPRAVGGRLSRLLFWEVVALCLLGDTVWQVVEGLGVAVPTREPVGDGLQYVDLPAFVSFLGEATGWSHRAIEAAGLLLVTVYVAAVVVAVVRITRAGRRRSRGPLVGDARTRRADGPAE